MSGVESALQLANGNRFATTLLFGLPLLLPPLLVNVISFKRLLTNMYFAITKYSRSVSVIEILAKCKMFYPKIFNSLIIKAVGAVYRNRLFVKPTDNNERYIVRRR